MFAAKCRLVGPEHSDRQAIGRSLVGSPKWLSSIGQSVTCSERPLFNTFLQREMLKPKHLLIVILLIAGFAVACDVAGLAKAVSRKPLPQASPHIGNVIAVAEKDIPPTAIRLQYFNPDGSCVQCSFGMHGVKCNNDNSANLLKNSEYGTAERGGSSPSRVSAYCNARGIDAYVVTGQATREMMKIWALTGRGAAIALESRHFQFVSDYDPQKGIWYVCDNRHPKTIDAYSETEFERLHVQGGQWAVFLKCHAPGVIPVTEVTSVRCDSPWLWLRYLFV
jgi:hypothetical protein